MFIYLYTCSTTYTIILQTKLFDKENFNLYGPLCFDSCYGSVDIFRDDITTVKHTASHVLAMTWIAFHHLIGWFKTCVGNLSH